MRRVPTRFAVRTGLLTLAICPMLGMGFARTPGLTLSQAYGEEWRRIPTGAGPSPRRQEGLIVDATGRLIVAGGENSDGKTWALDLAGPGNWIDLNSTVPGEANDIVRAVYDAQDNKMILVTASLTIYALDLATPGAPWTSLVASGTGPSPRRYPAVAYDSKRNRLLLFGGGPDTGVYSDVWALDLSGTPAWHLLNPAPEPSARWAAVAIYDRVRDRLVIGTGNDNGGVRADFWALSLASPTAWVQISPAGDLPSGRYLSAAGYAPGSDELVLFGGHNGGNGLNDVSSLSFEAPEAWRRHTFTTATPAPVWSHALAYDDLHDELITYGGWDGSNFRNEVWALPQVPVSTVPKILSFSPLGGRVGDEVRINGSRLSDPVEVLIGGVAATVLSSSFSSIRAVVPEGAVTGPIQVTNSVGTTVSDADFFVGELPQITSFTPDSSKAGGEVEIHGSHLASVVSVKFGGTGSAILGLIADDVVHVIVDSLASTGPIQLTTLVGTTTSAGEFLVIADDPRPRLLSVRDVRGDQGGKVMLRWRASDFDQTRYRQITGYRVWRRAPLTDATASARPAKPQQGLPQIGPDVFWESIADLPAAFLKGYAFAAPTLSDSSEAGNPYTAYFVQALTTNPFVFYNSTPDSGYSVDNLSPPAPSPLAIQYGPAANAMHWHPSGAADLRGYELYRGASSSFVPSPATLIAATAETSYTDGPGSHYYKLAAVDVHGNRSRFVAVAPDVPVGTLASLAHSERRPGHVQLSWYSGGNTGMQAHVQRRTETSTWATLGSLTVDGSGFIRFDDTSAEDGLRYAYRLAILDVEGGEDSFTSESWIEPLAAGRLSLALGANPVVGGRIPLVLTLPNAAHATVRLFDLAGRELERRDILSSGDGRADVTLGVSTRLRPGLYLVRASYGDAIVTRRVAVIL